jgi:hypothetical protein
VRAVAGPLAAEKTLFAEALEVVHSNQASCEIAIFKEGLCSPDLLAPAV